jgi:transcriptional regulator with XRE-family HTH domain
MRRARPGNRESARRHRTLLRVVGDELERARADAGLTKTALAQAAGIDRAHLHRIELGLARASIEVLVAIASALGGELQVRFLPGTGPAIRDRLQAMMIEELLRRLHPRWKRTLEVAVQRPVRGIIDLVLHDEAAAIMVATEAQSEVRRLEQHLRWSREKAEALPSSDLYRIIGPGLTASPAISRLLLLRSTPATRALARRFPETLAAAYPARSSAVHAALTTAEAPWPGDGILWARVTREAATLLAAPPRGVSLGR